MRPSLLRRLAGAVQFLTVVPVPLEGASAADAAVLFPVAGALIGASAGAVAIVFELFLGRSLGALIAIAWLAWVSGGLHEDGLADVADAVRAGRSRDRMMEILKDSRIGTYGAVALILSILVRWQAIASIATPLVPGITAAVALSRASMVIAAGTTSSLGTGLGRAFAAGCGHRVLVLVLVQCLAVIAGLEVLVGSRRVLLLALACFVVGAIVRWWFVRRLGGLNGDCLGATSQAVEVTALLVLACR